MDGARDFPVFRPDLVKKQAQRMLLGTSEAPGLGTTWSGACLDNNLAMQMDFAVQAADSLSAPVPLHVLANSLDGLSGILTFEAIELWCWRIAANLDHLLAERPLIPGIMPREQVEAPLEVIYTALSWSTGKRPQYGALMTCRVIAGPCCPLRVTQWMPFKFLYVLAREVGLHSRRYEFSGSPAEFFGMRFLGMLVPKNDRVRWTTLRVGQFLQANQKLRREREKPCPANCDWACHDCGTGVDLCPSEITRACRLVTMVDKPCVRCDKVTLHDEGGCTKCNRRAPSKVPSEEAV